MRAILFSTLILFAGCNVFENEQSVPEELVGEWEWTFTNMAWGPNISADTAGYQMTLFIYSQNIAKWYKGDSLMVKFKVEKENEKNVDDSIILKPKTGVFCTMKVDYGQNGIIALYATNCDDVPSYVFRKAGN